MTDSLQKQGMTNQELHRSLNLVIYAITFGMAFFTVFNGPSLSAFTRSLGAGDFIYAVIMSMPVFAGIVQVLGSWLMRHAHGRKKLFIIAGLVHRLLMIPVALVPILVPEQFTGARVWLIIIFIAIGSSGAAITSITFSSWMGALVPSEIRGRYFSKRALISTLTSVVIAPLAGFFLDAVKGPTGYAILFIFTAILGAVDILFFIWVKDPPLVKSSVVRPMRQQLLLPLKDKNYRQLIVFATIWMFAVNIAAPFFTPFMLETIGMSMLAITLLTQALSNIVTILFISRIGRLMDKYGVKSILTFSAFFISFMPVLWLLATPANWSMIVIVQLIAGFTWPAFDMGAMNFSIWLAPEEERPSYIALYALATAALGILPGQLIGGALMEFVAPYLAANPVPWIHGNMHPFHVNLVFSMIIRILALIFLLPRIHDPQGQGTGWDVAVAMFKPQMNWKKHVNRERRKG